MEGDGAGRINSRKGKIASAGYSEDDDDQTQINSDDIEV